MLAFPEFDGLLKILVTIIISSGKLRDDIKLVWLNVFSLACDSCNMNEIG